MNDDTPAGWAQESADFVLALTDSQKKIDSLTATVEQLRGRVEIAHDRAQEYETRIADLKCEIGALEQDNRALKARQWEPAPGHWHVANAGSGLRTTWVGEITDVDQARIRVALQAAQDAAIDAVLALRTPNQDCNVPVIDHRAHHGPCAVNPSTHDVVSAVLDAVAVALAQDPT